MKNDGYKLIFGTDGVMKAQKEEKKSDKKGSLPTDHAEVMKLFVVLLPKMMEQQKLEAEITDILKKVGDLLGICPEDVIKKLGGSNGKE